ncbi:twin-arginine translocation pathway signal [Sphingopyxis macrogoltabida]|uniref:Twin-arginine translocation pathway signal n=2 Tax=Sphingopyxis macrogoltabida TaxID=33050 RepID=A0AAC9AWT9_SPHMC|nr:twin-arginine translocation pathway signal [Sphingopyxis macrogoltabida]
MSRRHTLAGLGAGAAGLVMTGPAAALETAAPKNDAQKLLDSVADNLLAHSPEGATSLGIDTGDRAAMRGQLGDRSPAGQQALAATLKADLARVRAIDTGGLDHATRTSLAVVESAYGVALDGFAQPYGDVAVGGWRNTPYVVIQNVGAYLDVPKFLDSDHPVKSAADAEAYLARLNAFPGVLDGETERLKAAGGQGLVAPAFLIDKAVKQMEASLADAKAGGSMVESLVRRAGEAKIAGDWNARSAKIVEGPVAAALERQLAELKAQRPKAVMDAGMWARPGGDEFYAWALRASTTTRMTPDEVHAMGRAELAELHGRMDPILKKIGYSEGSVGDRMNALAKDPKYKFPDNDAGRAEIVAYIQTWLGKIRAELPRAFRTLGKGNVEVKRLPLAEEPGAPAAYGGAGSIDGSIPGRFWINLRTTELHSKYSLPDLTMHEAIPGHAWQGEYANKMPLIRTMLAFNAYSEGWGLYAEQLADELGLYDDFEVGRLGYLQSLAFRACRLVVDTGIHAKRWTREQGVEFFVRENGSNPLEVASEVDRYCSWVGQACGYKVGHSEIVRQRGRAQTALGAKYDLRDFDNVVVDGGNVPLDVLAKNVDEYIAKGGVKA